MAKLIRAFVCASAAPARPGRWGAARAARPGGRRSSTRPQPRRPGPSASAPLRELVLDDVDALALERVPSGMPEVDRVLGGGWVAGSALLLAGEPGVGKSTLLLQLADESALAGRTTLYVAGEESPGQVKLRAGRLGVAGPLAVTRETDAATLAAHLRAAAPALAIVDSIQTLTSEDGAAPGSPSQVRDATALLTLAAKEVRARRWCSSAT
jgi:predicted ATP-dependent serine protease